MPASGNPPTPDPELLRATPRLSVDGCPVGQTAAVMRYGNDNHRPSIIAVDHPVWIPPQRREPVSSVATGEAFGIRCDVLHHTIKFGIEAVECPNGPFRVPGNRLGKVRKSR